MNRKIILFTQLNSWKEAHQLILDIYKASKNFPKEEINGLTSQIRRAAISITSNIAEGFGRRSYKEKLQFYYHAHYSLIEVKNHLLVAKDLKYLQKKNFDLLISQADRSHQLLQGLLEATKQKI